MHSFNWDDLKFVLAVVEQGSLGGAARQLGVNHATVLRRVKAFEDAIGGQVFTRTSTGYEIRPEKLRLVAAAQEVGHAVTSVERMGAGRAPGLSGPVRITTTDTVAQCLMPDILADFARSQPDLNIQLVVSNTHLNLSRLQAEVTVRPALSLPEGLAGEVAGRMRFAVYGPAGGLERDAWLGVTGPLAQSRPAAWLRQRVTDDLVAGQADSFLVLREMVARGLGRAVLPCFAADQDDRLARDMSEDIDVTVPAWVACHEELADIRRLKTLRAALVGAIERRADRLDP